MKLTNNYYLQNRNNNFYSGRSANVYPSESSKDNTELSPKQKKDLDYSLKELRREINEMSNNLHNLNRQTDKYISDKTYSLNSIRSNSSNPKKISISSTNILDNSNNNLNNNLIYNEYSYKNNNRNRNKIVQLKNKELEKYNKFNSKVNNIINDDYNGGNNIQGLNYSNYNKINHNYNGNYTNASDPNKMYNLQLQNNNYFTQQNAINNKNKRNNINNRALSVDTNNLSENYRNQNEKMQKLINERKYLIKENQEFKNKINYYMAQLNQKDSFIEKLKEETQKFIQMKNKPNNMNINEEQILAKNRELIEENEKLKIKLKNQIENGKKIVKDKIRSNILNNSHSDEIIKINNQVEYWQNEYDKLYAEKITLEKNLEILKNDNEVLNNNYEDSKRLKNELIKLNEEKNEIIKEKENIELKLKNNIKENNMLNEKINILKSEIEEKKNENVKTLQKMEEINKLNKEKEKIINDLNNRIKNNQKIINDIKEENKKLLNSKNKLFFKQIIYI